MCMWCAKDRLLQVSYQSSQCQDEVTRIVRRLKFLRWAYSCGRLSEFTADEPGLVPAPGWWSKLDAGVDFAQKDFELVAQERMRQTIPASDEQKEYPR